jgi:hypothetical protein
MYKTLHKVGLIMGFNNCLIWISNIYSISTLKYGNLHFTTKEIVD